MPHWIIMEDTKDIFPKIHNRATNHYKNMIVWKCKQAILYVLLLTFARCKLTEARVFNSIHGKSMLRVFYVRSLSHIHSCYLSILS